MGKNPGDLCNTIREQQEAFQNSIVLETLGRAREVPGPLPCLCRKILPCPEAIAVCSHWSHGCSSHYISPREYRHSQKLGLSILLDQRQRTLGSRVVRVKDKATAKIFSLTPHDALPV